MPESLPTNSKFAFNFTSFKDQLESAALGFKFGINSSSSELESKGCRHFYVDCS